jgi:hypothetical protein
MVTLIWGVWSLGGGRAGGDTVDSDSRPLDVRSSRRKGGGRSELKFAVYNRTDMRCGELEGVGHCIRSPCDHQIALCCPPHGGQRYLGWGDLTESQVDGITSNIQPRSVLACNSEVR